MLHDIDNTELKKGDRVVVELDVRLVKKPLVGGDVDAWFWLNSRQVRKVAEEKPVAVGDHVTIECRVSAMGYGNVRLETDELGSPNPVPFWVSMDKVRKVP